MPAIVPHTAWVRLLNGYSNGSPTIWIACAWGKCREDAVDALEHWLACNPNDAHEWLLLPEGEHPQPRPK